MYGMSTGAKLGHNTPREWQNHIALALGLAGCQRNHRVIFATASALVSETDRGPR